MPTIKHKNLTIIFGDKTLSCDPNVTTVTTGISSQLGNEPFRSIVTKLQTPYLILPHQTHSLEAITITSESEALVKMSSFSDADIVITTIPEIAIGVLTADCLPIVLFDAKKQILATVHAGWRGTLQNVSQEAVTRMIALGTIAKNMVAYFGPCAHVETYQAPPDLIKQLAFSKYRDQVLKPINGEINFDLPLMNKLQLQDAGLSEKNIIFDYCQDTLTSDSLWSYRRDREHALRQPTVAVFN